jgi:hypothetical protein
MNNNNNKIDQFLILNSFIIIKYKVKFLAKMDKNKELELAKEKIKNFFKSPARK